MGEPASDVTTPPAPAHRAIGIARPSGAATGTGAAVGAALPTSDTAEAMERVRGAELHKTVAELLAAREDYESAYWHLRSAMDLLRAFSAPTSGVPEQLALEVEQLRRDHAVAKEQSLRDSLTAAYNRRYLDQWLFGLVAHGLGGAGTAVAIVDLDWFKRVNDTYGHHIGDRVLRQVAALLQRDLPDGAFCARYGGEEFVLVLPDVDAPTAVGIAEATRGRVERYDWSRVAHGLQVTVSVGLHHQPAGVRDGQLQLRSADRLLYTAKRSGRNVVAYTDGHVTRLARSAGGGAGNAPAASLRP